MNETTVLLTLASVHFVALMSPGPDFALVVQSAGRHGRRTGVFIALGLSLGILLHALFSLTGVSFLIQQHPLWFLCIKLAGGSYLLWLGVGALKYVMRHWRQRHSLGAAPVAAAAGSASASAGRALVKGFTTNILNPKALVFFVSLMSSLVPVSMSTQGKLMALLIIWGLSLGWFAALAWLLTSQRLQQRLNRARLGIDAVCGGIFTLLGGAIVLQSLTMALT
ncbi:Threonine/homoserine/homoserine lactone efflux protein [Ferrimonas sediminum]|uniref:Threonine/homoserine/homoserine lactone efflux protein n=1 Tax=Ferrimonas sediminum TaxID=718193 RepID=A0A1G8SB75_9GAMM|nr:LysE family translocator [Ferrimonas sediminum]SDJ25910.1 Threonine/homoserine/homoserine lactone efflux protein [Ferrimonas sediminum]